jgi:general secretion pathway protein D
MSPEVVSSSQKEIPEGRRRLTKVFTLQHVQATELQEKIRTALSDKATVTIGGPYQIVITDYNDNLRVAGELIEALDSERPQDMAVRVIALKNIGAQDLSKELSPLYQKMGTKLPQDSIDVAADDRANALMVFSSEASFNALQQIISLLDTDFAQEKIMETFTLRNADAQDVAKQLQDLGQNQTVSARYYFYSGSGGDANAKKMTVVADRRRNAVVVQAPPAQMEGIRKMVAQLDEPVSDDSLAPKIYRLKYVSAVDMEDVLNELFLKKTQQRSYWDFFSDEGPQSTADRDVGRLYGKVRITSEPYANAIIVTSNSKENLAVVDDVLHQLDAPSEAGESTLRLGLKYSKAATVANSLNILFAKNGSPPLRPSTQQNQANTSNNQQQQNQQGTPSSTTTGFELQEQTKEEGYYPWLGGQPDVTRNGDSRSTTRPVSDLVGRVRAVADDRSNALLLSANVHYFPQILKLINDLDVPTDQVLIDARIVEVSSDYLHKLGVRWSPDGNEVFTSQDYDNSFLASVNGSYQKSFGGNTTVNGATLGTPTTASSILQSLTTLRSGVIGGNLSLDFLVQFLHETTDASVLGNPQITIADNDTARLFVGQRVPTITGQVNPSVGGSSQNFVYQDVGVILEVNPHINKEGDVELKIHVESSSVVPGQAILNVPFIAANTFHTDLRAKDGQTLVVGGIIQKQLTDTLRKTPILGDIPGLGWLFKKRDKETQDVELMVFLKPKVVANAADAQQLLNNVNQNAPRLQKWEKDSLPAPPQPKS